jgi:aspartate/methionine/tyrosine aminotransferase
MTPGPASLAADPTWAALPGGAFGVRAPIASLRESKILEVWQMGFTVPDVIGLWVGEGDLPTPPFICRPAIQALEGGETFYTHKHGLPELRQALADYHADIYGVHVAPDRFTVTSAGMSAAMLAMQMFTGAGDNIIGVTPVWPNALAAAEIMGAQVREVALDPLPTGWALDLERVFARCDARTRAVYLASPGNPTGWVMPSAQQRALLDFCRRRGLWLIADEVYGRIVYRGRAAPSFLEVAAPDDPLIVINSFSKAWAMTGWRLGWMIHPEALAHTLGNLIEYNTSGAQPFLQRGAVAALREGEPFVAEMVERCRAARDLVLQRLGGMKKVEVTRSEAAFYLMFRVKGVTDTLAFAKMLVTQARVGLAPGVAFGAGGEAHLRLCHACGTERVSLAMDRLQPFLD